MVGITSLNAQILSRSFRNQFDITPVAGIRKGQAMKPGFSVFREGRLVGWGTGR